MGKRLTGFDYSRPMFYMVTIKCRAGVQALSEIVAPGTCQMNAITRDGRHQRRRDRDNRHSTEEFSMRVGVLAVQGAFAQHHGRHLASGAQRDGLIAKMV